MEEEKTNIKFQTYDAGKVWEGIIFDCFGNLYVNMGNLMKAEEFFLKSLKIRQIAFGENDINVSASLNNLGNLYFNTGNLIKAEDFYSKSFKIEQNILTENHSLIALSLSNLASVYCVQGISRNLKDFI